MPELRHHQKFLRMKIFDLKQRNLVIFVAHRSLCVKNICVSDLKSDVFCPCPSSVCVLGGKSGLKSKVASDMTAFLEGVGRGVLRDLVPVCLV